VGNWRVAVKALWDAGVIDRDRGHRHGVVKRST